MFSPQRKMRQPFTPRSEARASGSVAKGKAVVSFDDGTLPPPPPPPPPVGFLNEGMDVKGLEEENMDDWRRFKEVGLLDKAAMERRDHEALVERASKLERELFDYQHNMGLLLIEKKEWTSRYQELNQSLEEALEIIKREQSAYLRESSEAEHRVNSLRRALEVEKQCVADLQKALYDVQDEHTKIKLDSQTKLVNANDLVLGMEEKSMIVKEQMCAAEAKLAEADRKSSEIEKKLRELENRESLLQRERLSLNTEREAHAATFYKQREDLKESEEKLQKDEERLCQLRRTLNQREEKENDVDMSLKQKEMDLEEKQKKLDASSLKLKEIETGLNNQIAELDAKEMRADSVRSKLDRKEKELLALEEKLIARENMEIQNILDEHGNALAAKMQGAELEFEERRKTLDEELKNKGVEVSSREAEVKHKEEKMEKQARALDMKSERFKAKEKDLEDRMKMVKEKEKSMKAEQNKLESEKQKLISDREDLQISMDECETMRAKIAQQEQQILQEKESLTISEKERSEYLHLQMELKQELEKCRIRGELLLKEREDLKLQREKFEKQWEELDEKQAAITKELGEVEEEKEKFQRMQSSEEQRLKQMANDMQENIKSELEAITQKKELLETTLKHEKMILFEKAQSERSQMLQDFESNRRDLETDMINRQLEMEKDMQKKEKAFEEEREQERNNINHLNDDVIRKQREVESERERMEKGKQEVAINKEMLNRKELGLRRDIDELVNLSRKVQYWREQFKEERSRFLAFVEKHSSCTNCGESTREFVLSDLRLPDMVETEAISFPTLADEFLGKSQDDKSHKLNVPHSGNLESAGKISWIRKCTSKIFSVSPSKNIEPEGTNMHVNDATTQSSVPEQQQLQFLGKEDAIDFQQLQSDNNPTETTAADGYSLSVDDHSYANSKVQDATEVSKKAEAKRGKSKGVRPKSGSRRTRSMQPNVVNESRELNNTEDDLGTSSLTSKAVGNARKRQRAHASGNSERVNEVDSEGHSDSTTARGQRKKQQTVTAAIQTVGEKRYNLRRHKAAVAAPQVSNDSGIGLKDDSVGGATEIKGNKGKSTHLVQVAVVESVEFPKDRDDSVGDGTEITGNSGKSTHLVQVPAVKRFEVPKDKVVRFKMTEIVNSTVNIPPCSEELNGISEYRGEQGNIGNEAEDDENGNINNEAEDDSDNESYENPGEASIGKKILKFFLT